MSDKTPIAGPESILFAALAGLTMPCTRADYTVSDLDKVVCELAENAIREYLAVVGVHAREAAQKWMLENYGPPWGKELDLHTTETWAKADFRATPFDAKQD